MGLFGSSSPAPPSGDQSTPPSTTPTETPPSDKTNPPSAPAQTDDEKELAKFYNLFQAADAPPKPTQSSPTPQAPPKPPSRFTAWWPTSTSAAIDAAAAPKTTVPEPTTPEEIAKEEIVRSLMPTKLKCRDAFDYAYACNGLVGQWNAVYRHGEVRKCSELWDNFWFCMRVRAFSDEMRANAIRDHWREKEHRKYGPGRPSSEDIWQPRLEKVEPGTAFRTPLPPMPADGPLENSQDDVDFYKADLEHRRKIRESVGLSGSWGK